MNISGGCHCGAIRYQSTENAVEAGYCHCSICRKTTSSLVVGFASFPVTQFAYIKGSPSVYRSSLTGQREFCHNCGTQICHRRIKEPETVDVNTGSLDDIESIKPQFHIYTGQSVAWLNIVDNLPRFQKGPE